MRLLRSWRDYSRNSTKKKLTSALTAITAAVVGVVLNLAVWFGRHVFLSAAGAVDWFAVFIWGAALIAMLRYKIDIIPVVISAAILGLVYRLLIGAL